MNHRETAYALLRVTQGVIFLFYRINKFISGVGSFVGNMNQQFSGKLRAFMVMPFACAIQTAEGAAVGHVQVVLVTRSGFALPGPLLHGITFVVACGFESLFAGFNL